MSNRTDENDAEFLTFLTSAETKPPQRVSESILKSVRADLNPSFFRILVKILGLHVLFGSVSLLFCPQFGISPFKTYGLSAFYMGLGEHGCLAACGATFIAGSAVIAGLLLKREEVRALRRAGYFQIAILGVLSLGVFSLFGEGLALTLGMAWFAGLFFAGVLSLEIGCRTIALMRNGTMR